MGIIDAKRTQLEIDGKVTYDDKLANHKWHSTARYLPSLINKLSPILARSNRKLEDMYVSRDYAGRDGVEAWYLISSKPETENQPEIALYLFSDSLGTKTWLYIGWERVKFDDSFCIDPDDFRNLSAAEQDKMINTVKKIDPEVIWRKDRSVQIIADAWRAMPACEIDNSILKMQSKLLARIRTMELGQNSFFRNMDRAEYLIDTLDEINTPVSKAMIVKVKDAVAQGLARELAKYYSTDTANYVKEYYSWVDFQKVRDLVKQHHVSLKAKKKSLVA